MQDLVAEADAHEFVDQLIEMVRGWGALRRIIPAFFFVDPYGHPITIPRIRDLLGLGQTEVLVNLMWYSINMHLSNPKVSLNIDDLFGHTDWKGNYLLDAGSVSG